MSNISHFKLVDFDLIHNSEDFRCGNNMFSDDVWDFKGFIHAPHWNDAKFTLNFTPFNQWPSMKMTVKLYIATELLINSFNSVRRKLGALSQLRKFLMTRSDILSFKDFSKQVLIDFLKFVIFATKEQIKEENNGKIAPKPISAVTKKKAAQVVKELLIRGGTKGWEVPENTSFIQSLYNTLIIDNVEIKEGTKFGKTNKVLPEENIINKIIQLAIDDKDVITGSSIILSSQLGQRITEYITIKEGCLSIINGEYQITFTTSKTKKEPIEVTRPANQLVVEAVRRLEDYTRELRQKSGLPYLFLTLSNGSIKICSFSNWTKNRLRPFIKKHDIRDSKGNLIELSSHYFRHIFITYAIKKGMRITEVAEMANQSSISMTSVYDHTKGKKQEVVKKILSGEVPVATTNKIVLENLNGENNPFKGLTVDQIDQMRKALKIEILPHGVCLHHPLRGEPCDQDGVCLGCNHFLASADRLPMYEKRLDFVNREIEALGNDNGIYSSKLRYQAGQLGFYVDQLKEALSKRGFQTSLRESAVTTDGE